MPRPMILAPLDVNILDTIKQILLIVEQSQERVFVFCI